MHCTERSYGLPIPFHYTMSQQQEYKIAAWEYAKKTLPIYFDSKLNTNAHERRLPLNAMLEAVMNWFYLCVWKKQAA